MKKYTFILLFLVLLCLSACSSTNSNSISYTKDELDRELAKSYYRGIYNSCKYDNPNAPEQFCLDNLEFALDNDWYNLTDWPPMPDLTPLNSNTPVPQNKPGG